MGRKAKISYEIKFKFIEKYLNGNISQIGIARELGLHPSSIQGWIRKYKAFGPEGLKTIKKNTHYSSELKLSAVKDYINGKGSLADISLKYNLSCTGILTQWINKYNKCHKTCKSHNNKGDHIMTNGRKTTYEELEDLSESEKIAAQLKLLESENRHLKMENDFLKKLDEIERR